MLNSAEITLLVSPGDDPGTSRQRWVRIEVRRVMGESRQERRLTLPWRCPLALPLALSPRERVSRPARAVWSM